MVNKYSLRPLFPLFRADGDGKKVTFNLRFPGQYYDRESGLYYNYFRDYDPSTGRYVESDPIGLAAGTNLYAYVGGDPVNRIDPHGKELAPILGAAIAGGVVWLFKSCMERCTGEHLPRNFKSCGPRSKKKFSKCLNYCFNLSNLLYFPSDPFGNSASAAGAAVGGALSHQP